MEIKKLKTNIGVKRLIKKMIEKYPDRGAFPYTKIILFNDGSGSIEEGDTVHFSFDKLEELIQHMEK